MAASWNGARSSSTVSMENHASSLLVDFSGCRRAWIAGRLCARTDEVVVLPIRSGMLDRREHRSESIHVSDEGKDTGPTVEFALEQLNLIFDPEPFSARISIDDFYWTISGDISIESVFWENAPRSFWRRSRRAGA